MAIFLQNCFSFPTAIFTILLVPVVLYWLIAALGLLDLDILDGDGGDFDGDDLQLEGFAGLLMKLGLSGVPLTIILTFLILIGWFISYFLSLVLYQFTDITLIRYLLGMVILIATVIFTVVLTSYAIRPLRPLFKNQTAIKSKNLIGRTVIINSGKVTATNGYANYEDGGAGLILQVRAEEPNTFKRGDRAVIIHYDDATHSYDIISDDEFYGLNDK